MEYQALPVGIDAMALERQLAYGTEPWGDVDLEAWETITAMLPATLLGHLPGDRHERLVDRQSGGLRCQPPRRRL